MPATVGINQTFEWSAKALRYKRTATGKFVSERAVKLAVRRVIRQSQAEMRALTDLMNRREITLANWQERMRQELKNLHVSGAMAGAGGMANMTPADYGRVGQKLRETYRYLQGFARDIKARKLSAKQVAARAESYVTGMNASFEAAKRVKAYGTFLYEKNVLGNTRDDRHCKACKEQTRRGWVPIGSLIPIGERTCLSNCLCRTAYRKRLP